MAITTLSALGGVLQSTEGNEHLVAAIADGTAKAGWLCEITTAGLAQAMDIQGHADMLIGILLPSIRVDMDTAITGGIPVSVVIPKSGHLYAIYCDANSGVTPGQPHTFHATVDGQLDESADPQTASPIAWLYKGATGDEFQVFIWA